jgi:hypothetical protein
VGSFFYQLRTKRLTVLHNHGALLQSHEKILQKLESMLRIIGIKVQKRGQCCKSIKHGYEAFSLLQK